MSFQLEATEQSYSGSDLIQQAIRGMREAYEDEKTNNGLTQQKIAKKLGLRHRSIVNRWLLGKENMSLRSIGELAWAMRRRAVITFEACEVYEGNFSDINPHVVIEKIDNESRIGNISGSKDAWSRTKNRLTKYEPVFENVY